MTRIIQKRIRSGKDKDGRAFEPLSAYTIRLRSDKPLHSSTNPTKSNLTQTGRMVDDTVMTSKKAGTLQLMVKSRSSSKALEHIRGKNNKGRVIPVRNFLGLTRDEKRRLRNLVRSALVRRLR